MLLQKIDDDLKTAQKEKQENTVSALRNLKAAIKNVQIERQTELTNDDVLKVVAKKVKQHKDSIESFTAGNRQDLAALEIAQMTILEKYLPAQMTEAEVEAIVQGVVKELNPTPADFGKVMKEAMSRVSGQADGSVVSKLVKEALK